MSTVVAGKYRLDGVIGTGSFGTVYRGEHTGIGRAVAVKVLQVPEGMEDRTGDFRSRFMREAKILGKLEHPNAVQVFDFGEHNGHPFLVMELLRGRTLQQRLKADGAMSETDVHHITTQVLAALARAHDLGLVHRDLKPANVMLVPGPGGEEQVKLLDFGIATAFRDDGLQSARDLSVTAKGTFVGTAPYAAPEQFMGSANSASDVYGVGLLMWHMLVGEPAVRERDVGACARRHLDPEPWSLPSNVGVSEDIKRVVHRALQKDAGERYADATAMLSDLQAMTRASTAEHVEPVTQVSNSTIRDEPGDLLVGKYRLERVIGVGGFSKVFLATHVDMDRNVAVKLLDLKGAVAQTGGTTADDLRRRFGREAKMSSQLTHQNTITVYDFGVDPAGRWYLVMEYIDGTNLYAAVRKQGAFEPRRAARITAKVLRSLSEAHHLGVLHRDLKPGNIMIAEDFRGEETVKVLDFGIATVHSMSESVGGMKQMKATQMGMFVGTPQYAAPEQFLGQSLTPATDVYAVGLVLFEMLAGRAAVEADAYGRCLQQHLEDSPWRLPVELGVPQGLQDILAGALAKDPSKRYLSASEMADDLEAWVRGDQEEFKPAPVTEERWEPKFEYRSTDQAVIDPNLQDDAVPEFLATPISEEEMSGERPAAKPRPQKKQRRGPPKQEELKLDLDRPQQQPVRRDRIIRPSAVDDRRRPRPSLPTSWIAGAAGLALIVAVGYGLSTGGSDIDEGLDLTTEEPMYMNLEDPAPTAEPEQDINEFSAAGILKALEQAGWLVKRTGANNSLTNVHQQGYKLSRSGKSIEIELITTKSSSIAMQMFQDTRPPIQAVLFDNKLVRIFPPGGREDPAMGEIVGLLKRYRDLVREGGPQ